jgi:hypothetical protein
LLQTSDGGFGARARSIPRLRCESQLNKRTDEKVNRCIRVPSFLDVNRMTIITNVIG